LCASVGACAKEETKMASRQKGLTIIAIVALCQQLQSPAMAKDVTVDLSSIVGADAKTAPAAPKQPSTQSIEMHPDDVLIVRCPTKQFPGDKGWIEYHASLLGSGCLISSMNRREAHAEVFQATTVGSQKVVVGLKQPGSSQIEKDCIINVKVVATKAQDEVKDTSANVQSYAGQTVFGNKTSASNGNTTGSKNGTASVEKNQIKPTPHSIEEQSHSTVKTY
jgi:hypothetical protein